VASPPPGASWVDGRIVPGERGTVGSDDSAWREGRGCYTAVRVARGVPRFAGRHAARLRRDARALRLGDLPEALALQALLELAAAAFPQGEGILRFQVSQGCEGTPRLVGVPIPLGEGPDPGGLAREARSWSALVAPFPHEGPRPWSGCKVTSRLLFALAADAARAEGADEALLFDRQGRLVEGARSNLFVVGRDGALSTPPLERGAVAGIAREVVMERLPQVLERDTTQAQVREAEELIAVNAVRGAHAIASVDGRTVGPGNPSRWLGLIARALASD